MQDKDPIRSLGAMALAATGVLHLILAPEYLDEKTYVGALFIAGGIAAVGLAAAIWSRDDRRAWILGCLVAAGMAVGFILSRTVGLPGYHEGEWEISGLVSLLLEAAVVAAGFKALRPGGAEGRTSGAY